MKRIMLVLGTRPEAIKMCPLYRELKTRKSLSVTLCATGQHREMLDEALVAFGVRPDFEPRSLKRGQGLSSLTSSILSGVEDILAVEHPDLVLVHGDTATAHAAALAAFYRHIPVGHVEAGLRSHNIKSPFPEEYNRRAISLMAKYHFAPTDTAKNNLIGEGVPPEEIFVTGNTVADALALTVRKRYRHQILDSLKGGRILLLTLHRRESVGEPMRQVFRAVRRAVTERCDLRVIYPIHMNPAVREIAAECLGGVERVHIVEPLSVFDFHNILSRCDLVLTDSGGVQEEAAILGIPTLVAREVTERTEGVRVGALLLVGREEEYVYASLMRCLDGKREFDSHRPRLSLYGDGLASKRIADIIEKTLGDT